MKIRKILALARVTRKEFTQKEIVIAIICVWFAVMLTVLAFATVSIGERVLVLSDFGLFTSSLTAVLLIIFGGSTLLSKEIKRKSIYTVLSKPLTRTEYILGKFLGLVSGSILFNILLHLLLVMFLWVVEGQFLPFLLINIFYVGLESTILSALCLLVSAIMVTPALVGIVTAALFVAGRDISVLSDVLKKESPDSLIYRITQIAESLLPNLSSINIANGLTYRLLPDVTYTANSLLYTISYTVMILGLSIFAFRRREFN